MTLQLSGADILPKANLLNAWNSNHDGAGFMYCRAGNLVIEKPFFKFKRFYDAYASACAKYGGDSPFVLHFRYATHGDKSAVNTHPHSLADGSVGLSHNGILDVAGTSQSYSDTVVFCNTVLAHRSRKQLLNPEFASWLGALIGRWNKFIMLGDDGAFSIANEDCGFWENGGWYSNGGHLPKPKGIQTKRCSVLDDSLFDGGLDDHRWEERMREIDLEFERSLTRDGL